MLNVFSNKKMKKILAAASLAAFAAAGIACPALASIDTQIVMNVDKTVYTINGTINTMDTAPYIDKNDRTMVPVRFAAQALGAKVDWNEEDRTVTVQDNDRAVIFTIDSSDIKTFEIGKKIKESTDTIDTAAVIKDSRTMLPLRAVSEALGADVDYKEGVITINKEASESIYDTVSVSNYQQLELALGSEASTIVLDNFSTAGESYGKLEVTRPVVLDGNGSTIDFGIDIKSNGVTVKNFNAVVTDFNKAVSTGGQSNLKNPGDSIVFEVHNHADGEPVIIQNNTVFINIPGASNSAVYLADESYAEVTGNTLKLENSENNSLERGGVFIGADVSGKIEGNTIDTTRTAFPMSPIGLAANMDTLTGAVTVSPVTITGNDIKARYVTKMYASGQFFGDDNLVLESSSDFGVRAALTDFVLALDSNNTYEIIAPYPAEHEDAYVQTRLDSIMAGGTYFDNNIFFHVEDGKLVRIPAPVAE